jgi:hypothetical protein
MPIEAQTLKSLASRLNLIWLVACFMRDSIQRGASIPLIGSLDVQNNAGLLPGQHFFLQQVL